jgi:hypothetical protein
MLGQTQHCRTATLAHRHKQGYTSTHSSISTVQDCVGAAVMVSCIMQDAGPCQANKQHQHSA